MPVPAIGQILHAKHPHIGIGADQTAFEHEPIGQELQQNMPADQQYSRDKSQQKQFPQPHSRTR